MRKFDPWPIFFRREWNRNWPFLVGFAVTGALITKLSLGLTEEDAKNSAFVQRHKSLGGGFFWGLWKARFMPSYLAYGLAVSATRISDVQWEYPFFLQNHSQKESFPQLTRGKQFPPVLGSA